MCDFPSPQGFPWFFSRKVAIYATKLLIYHILSHFASLTLNLRLFSNFLLIFYPLPWHFETFYLWPVHLIFSFFKYILILLIRFFKFSILKTKSAIGEWRKYLELKHFVWAGWSNKIYIFILCCLCSDANKILMDSEKKVLEFIAISLTR